MKNKFLILILLLSSTSTCFATEFKPYDLGQSLRERERDFAQTQQMIQINNASYQPSNYNQPPLYQTPSTYQNPNRNYVQDRPLFNEPLGR